MPADLQEESAEREHVREQESKKEIDQLEAKATTPDVNPNEFKKGNVLDSSGRAHGAERSKNADTREEHASTVGLGARDNVWSADLTSPPGFTKDDNEPHRVGNDSVEPIPLTQANQAAGKLETRPPEDVHQKETSGSSPAESSKNEKLNYALPLKPTEPDKLVRGIELNALKYLVVVCIVCYACGRFQFNLILGLLVVAGGASAFWILGRRVEKGLEWQLEKQEGMKTLYTSEGESVEWLNFIAEKLWRSIDPAFFVLVEDILEDTLESVAPSMIKGVKVADFDIGVQAPRIQMIRVFPPLPGQPEESIFGEAAFSFRAHPVASLTANRSIASTPPGIAIQFRTGFKAPLDIKAELTAVSGKIRFKMLMSPELPFVSKVTIAFTSVPTIETAVMPISKHLNIMNLPMIKALVNEGIKLGFADLVEPKSMKIDVRALMGAAAQDTAAIGVVKVHVREATRDASLQFKDMEDSYVTLSLSNQPKKTMSSTRVLTNDKDPRWEEDLYVLVFEDDIVSDTRVDIKVWDADKVKYDDLWGSVSMSVKDIVQGKVDKLGNVSDWAKDERMVFDGWAPIDGKTNEQSKIKLNFEMTFHPKYVSPKPELVESEEKKQAEKEVEKPIDPEHKHGILLVKIHQAVDLEVADPEMATGEEQKHPYNPDHVVSPYAVLYINDNKVFRTRAKLRNPSPHWNAVSEHFVKDFDNAQIRISVKNSVDLERDPVLGTQSIKLKDLFEEQDDKLKQAEQWVPISNGIGFGKLLLTLKYKPVKLTIPPELSGTDVGTLVVDCVRLQRMNAPFDTNYISSTKAVLALNLDPVILKRLKARDLQKDEVTALYIHVLQGSITSTKATGRVWLKSMPDNEWQDITVGLRDYLPENSKEANRNEDAWNDDSLGQVHLRVKIIPGFSPVHTKLRSFVRDMVGVDPFRDENATAKAQQWIRNQSDEQSEEKGLERRRSSASSDYGQEEEEENEEDKYFSEMRGESTKQKISKYRVFRKLAWGSDIVKHKVDVLREGFNSEARAGRSVAKEV